MRLSWNEIRARAGVFADEWRDAHYEKGETQSFYNDFFDIFGVKRRRVASFEEPVRLLGDRRGFIDLFWKGTLLIEQKSAGRPLARARTQALDYFPGLKDHELPRYVLLCDFRVFELIDLDTKDEVTFLLSELPHFIEHFGFMIGVEKRVFKDQDPVNIQAAEIMGKLHDMLKASRYQTEPLERLLVRLLFCLFADDTGIFPERGQLEDFIKERTQEDGSDLGPKISLLFQILDTPESQRQANLEEELKSFPYVNGSLFAEILPIPSFNAQMRSLLIEACGFQWERISPAIFGALFQSVMDARTRRSQGAHYTTEKNILKVIQPLFLDNLWSEFGRLKERRDNGRNAALKTFHDKLSTLTFFDPACGCGNFLIISYRELRLLEIELLKCIYPERQLSLNAGDISKINVDQFYGIEINEFPARIAETAMWMMDHIMNNALSLEFGQVFTRIPLKKAPHITHADALEIDWNDVLSPSLCSYVFGNPPFAGAKVQLPFQRAQVKSIAALGGSGGTLDFVAAWFLKAGAYILSTSAEIAFVATNSITQGEQVGQLWPVLFDRYKLEISFAHQTFGWGSDARGMAHVHVVVIGLTGKDHERERKRLFSYVSITGDPVESTHDALSPYLFDASSLIDRHAVVKERNSPATGYPKIKIGSKPVDGGYLILTHEEYVFFVSNEPGAIPYLKPFIGAEEFLNGGQRWIFTLQNAPVETIRAMPSVSEVLRKVKQYRLGEIPSKNRTGTEPREMGQSSSMLADTPREYHVTVLPTVPFMCIPKTSSENREYIPIGWLDASNIPSDAVFVAEGASIWTFSLLTSRMHMAWMRFIGGRLESRYRYSIGLVYNPFPWPNLTDVDKEKLTLLGQAVLDARSSHKEASLADLYDQTVMPLELRRAHRAIDAAVDRLYRREQFDSDRNRVEHLFTLYINATSDLLTPAIGNLPRRRNKTSK